MNRIAVFRANRSASKSGCERATCMTASIAAIIAAGSMLCSVHFRSVSLGVGSLSFSGPSKVSKSFPEFSKGKRSAILGNDRLQFSIFNILIGLAN
jgi:hypothetical protein